MKYYIKHKRERKVNNKDNFFMVKIRCNNVEKEVGWIEHSFNEEEFKQKLLSNLKIKNVTILNVVKFKNEKEYNEYKHKMIEESNMYIDKTHKNSIKAKITF